MSVTASLLKISGMTVGSWLANALWQYVGTQCLVTAAIFGHLNCGYTPHPPYLTDLVPCYVLLFPSIMWQPQRHLLQNLPETQEKLLTSYMQLQNISSSGVARSGKKNCSVPRKQTLTNSRSQHVFCYQFSPVQ